MKRAAGAPAVTLPTMRGRKRNENMFEGTSSVPRGAWRGGSFAASRRIVAQIIELAQDEPLLGLGACKLERTLEASCGVFIATEAAQELALRARQEGIALEPCVPGNALQCSEPGRRPFDFAERDR